jgi:hypothetical protein
LDREPGSGASDAALGVLALGAEEGEGEVDAFDFSGPAFGLGALATGAH